MKGNSIYLYTKSKVLINNLSHKLFTIFIATKIQHTTLIQLKYSHRLYKSRIHIYVYVFTQPIKSTAQLHSTTYTTWGHLKLTTRRNTHNIHSGKGQRSKFKWSLDNYIDVQIESFVYLTHHLGTHRHTTYAADS